MEFVDLHAHLKLLPNPLSWIFEKYDHQDHAFQSIVSRLEKGKKKAIISIVIYNVPGIHWGHQGVRWQLKKLYKQIEPFKGKIKILKTKEDLGSDYVLGLVLQLESCRWLGKYKKDLSRLFDLGIRGVIPIHFRDNRIGKSCNDPKIPVNEDYDFGLNEDAKKFFKHCRKLGLWVDGSHMSERSLIESLKYEHHAYCVSHIGLRAKSLRDRALAIKNLPLLKEHQAIIGLCPWTKLAGGSKEKFLEQIIEFEKSGWPDGVALGTDYGAPILVPDGLKNYFEIVDAVEKDSRISKELREGFLWKNAYEFLERSLP